MAEILKVLAEHGGIYGIMLGAMAGALYLLWRHLQKTQVKYDTALQKIQDKYDKLQEARLAEAKEVVKELMEYSKTMDGLTAAVTALKDVIVATRPSGG